MKEKLDKIFSFYGYNHQANKLVEECAELVLAIAKDDTENMIEEMADVTILIEQFVEHFANYKEKFEKIREHKINRTIERVRFEKEFSKIDF